VVVRLSWPGFVFVAIVTEIKSNSVVNNAGFVKSPLTFLVLMI